MNSDSDVLMKSIWKNLPEDVVYKTIQYVSELAHVKKFASSLSLIRAAAANMKIRNIGFCWRMSNDVMMNLNTSQHLMNDHPDYFGQFLLRTLTQDEQNWLAEEMTECDCCGRHQRDKPRYDEYSKPSRNPNYCYSVIFPADPQVEGDNINIYTNQECRCSCRHILRWFAQVQRMRVHV